MTVQISTLRISAVMDASAYEAGMATKVAADRAGIASAQQFDVKVNGTADMLSRLSRQYVDGYGSAAKFASVLTSISRNLDTGKLKMAELGPVLDGIYKKYGLIADASAFAAKGQAEFAAAVDAANRRLIAGRTPTAANQNRLSGGQLQGLGYQANDVVTMALMGAPLSQIAVSQGGQILQTLQMNEGGIMGSLRGIKAGAGEAMAAVTAFLGPVGLIATGFGLAATAAGAYFFLTKEGSQDNAERIAKENELIATAAKRWGDAEPALKKYNDQLERQKDIADLLAAKQAAIGQQYEGPKAQLPGLAVDMGDIQSTMQALGQNSGQIAAVRKEYNELVDAISKGTASSGDALDVQRLLDTQFLRGAGNMQAYIQNLGDLATALDKASRAAEPFRSGIVEDRVQSMRDLRDLNKYLGSLVPTPPVRGVDDIPNPGPERDPLTGRLMSNLPVPGLRSIDDVPGDQSFMQDFQKSSEARLRQMQQEVVALGLSGKAVAAYRFEMDALNDALAKNIELSPQQKQQIHEQAVAFAQQADVVQAAKDKISQADDARGELKGFLGSVNANLAAGVGFWKSWEQAGLSAITSILQKLANREIDRLVDALIPGGSPSTATGSGSSLLDLAISAFSGRAASPAPFTANTTLSALLGAGGDVTGAAPVGAVTRSALPAVGSSALQALNDNFPAAGVTRGGIPLVQIGAQGLTAKINAQYAGRFQGLLDDLTAAGYPIKSLGEGGYSYRNVAGSTHLSKHAYGEAIDINPSRFGNPMAPGAKGNWAQYGIDPNEMAQRNGLFYGGNWRNADTMHFQVDKSAKAFDHLTASADNAAKGLGDFGTGASKMGSALSQFPAAPTGGGGLLNFAGSALSSVFSGTKAFNWLSANPGGFIGLYADGTDNAPPGYAIVGERGPELVKFRGGEQVVPNRSGFRTAPKWQEGGATADRSAGGFHVTIGWDKGSNGNIEPVIRSVVRTETRPMVEQGVQKGVGKYHQSLKNGGAAKMGEVYNADKAA